MADDDLAKAIALSMQETNTSRLVRHEIPADNSCLFNSVAYALNDSGDDKASELRGMVAGLVLSDPETWTEAMLGKPPEEYADWIQDSEHWGGGIELAILATSHEMEIAAVDIQTLRVSVFGEGQGFRRRALLIYDGIHYDVLVRRGPSGEERLFGVDDLAAVEEAKAVAKEAQIARNFTDVGRFTLRCVSCQKGLVGQQDAVEHAKATGYINFTEY
ncbi:unnamed protein product [Durusdinium trenchii]